MFLLFLCEPLVSEIIPVVHLCSIMSWSYFFDYHRRWNFRVGGDFCCDMGEERIESWTYVDHFGCVDSTPGPDSCTESWSFPGSTTVRTRKGSSGSTKERTFVEEVCKRNR